MLNQLQLHRRDRSSCALIDGPLTIGWIRTGIIGFGGFEDRREALAAGMAAAAIVTHWATARRAALVPPFPSHLTGLAEFPQHVPEADAIRGAEGVVARMLAPDEVDIDLAGHGFEVSVAPEMWVAVMLEVAQRIHRGLRGTSRGESDAREGVLEVAT